MNDVITNTFIFQNPKIDNVKNIVNDHIKNHHYRFIQFNIKCVNGHYVFQIIQFVLLFQTLQVLTIEI